MIYACLWICLLVFCGRRTVMGNLLSYGDRPSMPLNAHFQRNGTTHTTKNKMGNRSTVTRCRCRYDYDFSPELVVIVLHRQKFRNIKEKKNMKINVFVNIVWFTVEHLHAFCLVARSRSALQSIRAATAMRIRGTDLQLMPGVRWARFLMLLKLFHTRSRFRVRVHHSVLFFFSFFFSLSLRRRANSRLVPRRDTNSCG